METPEVNLGYFKHQTLQLLAVIKQLQIEDQYEAIIYILSAINTYLKNVFTCKDRDIIKGRISGNAELTQGHVNDVLSMIKVEGDCDDTTTSKENVGQNIKFTQLTRFPFYVRSNGSTKLLHRVQNRHLRPLSPSSFTYADWQKWTAGINQVNKLREPRKAVLLVNKVTMPRPIKRSLSLPATAGPAGKVPKKPQARSMSTTVRPVGVDDLEDENYMESSIDYDELILNPDLEPKQGVEEAQRITVSPPRKIAPLDEAKKIIVLENRVITEADKTSLAAIQMPPIVRKPAAIEELDDNDDEDEDDDDPKPNTSADVLPTKKPAKKRKTHPCLFCKKSYRSRKSLMLHFQHHPGYCPDCGEKIGYTAAEIVAHNRQHHINERPIICDLCGESFTRNQQYQIHLQGHERSKDVMEEVKDLVAIRYDCLECGLIFSNQKSLESHIMETEHKQDKRLCDICGIDFDTNTKLLQHLRRAHKPKSFTCEICNKDFTLKCNLDRHVKSLHTINPGKKFVCDTCGSEYTSQSSLNEHMESVHKKSKVYQCSHCDKTYFNKRLLKVHEIVHSESRPYPCTLCDQSYKRRSHLDRHVHFSHNKNGKVSRESVPAVMNGVVPPEDPSMMKPVKAPTASASAKKKKEAKVAGGPPMMPGYGPAGAQPAFNYDMHNTYGSDYNMDPHQGHHPAMHAPMPMQTEMNMYGGYGGNHQGPPQSSQPAPDFGSQGAQQQQQHHHQPPQHHHQYYAVQQPQEQWGDNMAASGHMYSSNSAMNSAGAGVPQNPNQEQMYGDYMQVDIKPDPSQMMGMPNSDLFYPQDANMWGGAGGNQSQQSQASSYNSIGNILTNLELIGNNSNFENSFDIVTGGQVVDNNGGQYDQQMSHQYNQQMQYDPQQQQQQQHHYGHHGQHHQHHMNYGN